MSKTSRPPISIDLGAKAEAKFQVEARVPTTSVGRFVDSITDMFRPFSEARGLRADQIRLQRAEVALEIARLARRKIEIAKGRIGSVPNKLLIPLIEKASNEDPGDAAMIERWAS